MMFDMILVWSYTLIYVLQLQTANASLLSPNTTKTAWYSHQSLGVVEYNLVYVKSRWAQGVSLAATEAFITPPLEANVTNCATLYAINSVSNILHSIICVLPSVVFCIWPNPVVFCIDWECRLDDLQHFCNMTSWVYHLNKEALQANLDAAGIPFDTTDTVAVLRDKFLEFCRTTVQVKPAPQVSDTLNTQVTARQKTAISLDALKSLRALTSADPKDLLAFLIQVDNLRKSRLFASDIELFQGMLPKCHGVVQANYIPHSSFEFSSLPRRGFETS